MKITIFGWSEALNVQEDLPPPMSQNDVLGIDKNDL